MMTSMAANPKGFLENLISLRQRCIFSAAKGTVFSESTQLLITVVTVLMADLGGNSSGALSAVIEWAGANDFWGVSMVIVRV